MTDRDAMALLLAALRHDEWAFKRIVNANEADEIAKAVTRNALAFARTAALLLDRDLEEFLSDVAFQLARTTRDTP